MRSVYIALCVCVRLFKVYASSHCRLLTRADIDTKCIIHSLHITSHYTHEHTNLLWKRKFVRRKQKQIIPHEKRSSVDVLQHAVVVVECLCLRKTVHFVVCTFYILLAWPTHETDRTTIYRYRNGVEINVFIAIYLAILLLFIHQWHLFGRFSPLHMCGYVCASRFMLWRLVVVVFLWLRLL